MSHLENSHAKYEDVEAELEQVNSALGQVAIPCHALTLQSIKQSRGRRCLIKHVKAHLSVTGCQVDMPMVLRKPFRDSHLSLAMQM